MKTRSRSAGGLTILLALSLVHLLFPIFVVYSWVFPSGIFAFKFKQQQQSKRDLLDACIKKAEQRQLASPKALLANPYDGSCLGRNRLNEARQQSDEYSSSLQREADLDVRD